MLHVTNASGRQVSLLCDDNNANSRPRVQQSHSERPLSYHSAYSQPSPELRSPPELSRSDSYDSHNSNDPISPITPMTPSADYPFSRAAIFPAGTEYTADGRPPKRPAYADVSRTTSFSDPDEPRRFECRFKDILGCEKTFTTSGHASRHAKIHNPEKGVECTYPSCGKKFTRSDNMKQHLETHYKDKSRGSGSRSHKSEARRPAARSRSRSAAREAPMQQWTTEQYPLPTPPLPSPNAVASTWGMHGTNLPLLNRPTIVRSPSSALDALAAVACQKGGITQ